MATDKPPVSNTQFSELEQSHSKLDSNHAETRSQLMHVIDKVAEVVALTRNNTIRLDAQGKELRANTEATKQAVDTAARTEKNTEEIITAANHVKAFFGGLVWIGEWIKKLALPVGLLAAVIGGAWAWLIK